MFFRKYPDAVDPSKVGSYPAETFSGGGYFYDEVLEYRMWAKERHSSVYHAFARYTDAKKFHATHPRTEEPIALVQQDSYIAENGDSLQHVHRTRITEWSVDWLKGTKGTLQKIPPFLAKHSRQNKKS